MSAHREYCREKSASWRRQNKEHHKLLTEEWRKRNPDRVNAHAGEWRKNNPDRVLLTGARYRAKKLGLPFDLELSDVVIPEFCPVLGVRMERSTGKDSNCDASPSLDRIVPAFGYVKGNVQVISGKANRIKNDATAEELLRVALFMGIRRRYENRTLAEFLK